MKSLSVIIVRVCVGQGGCQVVKGITRSLCKQVVYLHLLKHEKHLLSLNCEVKNVL